MSTVDVETRPFRPGTTGWTAADLDDPEIERLWFRGRYEIVEGVLAEMPAAYFAGGESLTNLIYVMRVQGVKARFATEVDVVVSARRVARSDAAVLLPADSKRQAAAARKAGKTDLKRTRIYVPPTLIIESLSPGHEDHDLETKRRWYAEFGVPHYWILDAFAEELLCLRLKGRSYVEDASGRGKQTVRPSLFEGLRINLSEVWGQDDAD
jgi:Uma2 family endonuclease